MDSSTSAPLEMCFICGGPETPTQKLVLVTSKVYHGLLGYVETVANAEILKRLNEAYEVKSVRYRKQCKCDLYNESVKVTTELSFSFLLTQTLICHILVAAKAEKESVQNQRRRSSSASAAFSSNNTRSAVQLAYKNVCILCNQPVDLFPNHPGKVYLSLNSLHVLIEPCSWILQRSLGRGIEFLTTCQLMG